MKAWRVEVLRFAHAEVVEFDDYSEAIQYARLHSEPLDDLLHAQVLDFGGYVVWDSRDYEPERMSGLDAPAGFYSWSEDVGWCNLPLPLIRF